MSKDYVLEIGKSVVNDLKRLPLKQFKQVMVKVLKLQTNPQPQDCRSLKGYPGGYRVDQGKYRLLYIVERDTVRIFRVGKGNNAEV